MHAIEKATEVFEHINELIGDYTVSDNTKDLMLAGLLSIVREHYSAMIELIKIRHYGSASALARPLYEAYVRLTWLAICGSEQDAEAINNDNKKFKGITDLSRAIDCAIADNAFMTVLKNNEEALHDYTHGGIRQIARRFNSEGNIEATFEYEELEDLLKTSGMSLALSCMGFFAGINDQEKVTSARDFIIHYPSFGV